MRDPIKVDDPTLQNLAAKWEEAEKFRNKLQKRIEKMADDFEAAAVHEKHFELRFWEAVRIYLGFDPHKEGAAWDFKTLTISFEPEEDEDFFEEEDDE